MEILSRDFIIASKSEKDKRYRVIRMEVNGKVDWICPCQAHLWGYTNCSHIKEAKTQLKQNKLLDEVDYLSKEE